MAILSIFYGIIISMFYGDDRQRHKPHVHAKYQGYNAVFSIPDGELLSGELPPKKMKLVQAWIALHEDELMANWKLATGEKNIFPIEPLK